MKREKRIEYQRKKNAKLNEIINQLKQENKVLKIENESLCNKNDSLQLLIENMRENCDSVMGDLNAAVDEANQLKSSYKDLIFNCRKIKKEYEDKITLLLKQLKKQKT